MTPFFGEEHKTVQSVTEQIKQAESCLPIF